MRLKSLKNNPVESKNNNVVVSTFQMFLFEIKLFLNLKKINKQSKLRIKLWKLRGFFS